MLIFVYGEDGFRVRERVRELKRAFRDKFDAAGMNLAEFPAEGKRLSAADALQAALSVPFMSDKRMVVIEGAILNASADDKKAWQDGLGRVPSTNIVVLVENGTVKDVERRALFKKLRDGAEVHAYPFPMLEGAALSHWVASRVQSIGASIGSPALRELIGRTGPDLWRLANECEKLAAAASGSQIGKALVEELVPPSFEGAIFDLMDALSRRDMRALARLEEERASGANDFYLLTMITRQARILLAARDLLDRGISDKAALASSLGVHPFVAQKALQQARNFDLGELVAIHDSLLALDAGAKSGRNDAATAVDLASASLTA